MTIESMIEATISKEGGYSNLAADRGGATNYGITQAVARANGYKGDMRNLPRETAVAIYRQEYAIKPGFAAVAEIYPQLGEKLFDVGVNMGPARPARWLQEWLNLLNQNGKLYPDIVEDGKIGPGTLRALRSFKAVRGAEGEKRLLTAIRGDQVARYKEIVQNDSSQAVFLFGWLGRAY